MLAEIWDEHADDIMLTLGLLIAIGVFAAMVIFAPILLIPYLLGFFLICAFGRTAMNAWKNYKWELERKQREAAEAERS